MQIQKMIVAGKRKTSIAKAFIKEGTGKRGAGIEEQGNAALPAEITNQSSFFIQHVKFH